MNQNKQMVHARWAPWLVFGVVALASQAQAATFLGIVYPLKDLTLSVQAAGVVRSADVKVGQAVKANQVLLTLDAAPKQLEVRRRETMLADHSQLTSGAERLKLLQAMVADAEKLQRAGGVISQDEVRKLQLELATAKADYQVAVADKKRQEIELSLARAENDQYVLRAPRAGVITEFPLDAGEWAAPGDPIARLVDVSVCEVRVKVSAQAAAHLKLGQSAALKIHDASAPFVVQGKITFVSPVSDAASSLVDVRLRVANPDGRIRAGTKASMDVGGVN